MPPGYSASTPSVGVQATSPANNLITTNNSIPSNQVATKDLSGTYGKASNGTIYNIKSQTAFSKPEDFYKDSGQTSFDNLKFGDYAPTGKETIYGQAVPAPTPIAQPVTPTATSPTPNSSVLPYTPPNQGTTGVSQGGLIGNLINQSQQENPNYTVAKKKIEDLALQQTGLLNDYATQNKDIQTNSGFLGQAQGREGLLNTLLAQKQAALAPQYNAAVAELGAANTQSSTQIGAGAAAANANAPQFVSPGQVQINPSQPPPGSTVSGGTLASMVGERRIPGQTQTEFYNTQTGQGFTTPQALADFVNKQMPGANATPQNVFEILKNPQSNIVGGNSSLNPISNIPNLVQAVVSGRMSLSDALSQGGNVPNFSGALVAAISQADPQFDFVNSQASAAAKASNIQGAGTAATDAARQTYVASYPAVLQLNQALNNVASAANITIQNAQGQNINPLSFVPGNTIIRDARSLFSSSGQAVFNSNLANLEAAIRNIYSANGGSTPSGVETQIGQIVDGSMNMDTLKALIDTAQKEGQARLTNAQATAQSAFNQTQTSANSSTNIPAPHGTNNNSTTLGLF